MKSGHTHTHLSKSKSDLMLILLLLVIIIIIIIINSTNVYVTAELLHIVVCHICLLVLNKRPLLLQLPAKKQTKSRLMPYGERRTFDYSPLARLRI